MAILYTKRNIYQIQFESQFILMRIATFWSHTEQISLSWQLLQKGLCPHGPKRYFSTQPWPHDLHMESGWTKFSLSFTVPSNRDINTYEMNWQKWALISVYGYLGNAESWFLKSFGGVLLRKGGKFNFVEYFFFSFLRKQQIFIK